jgi:bla regulator protein BlaR1
MVETPGGLQTLEHAAASLPGRADLASAGRARSRSVEVGKVLGGVWLFGVAVMVGVVGWQAVTTRRRVRSWPELTAPEVLAVLAECKAVMGVKRKVELRFSRELGSPALCGGLRPCILVPLEFIEQFKASQWRLIFLHELAHVRRGDVWWNWLALALQALHWFNPVLWLGFHRWRADRELACDGLTLEMSGEGCRREYANTILQLLDTARGARWRPGWVGISEDARELRRRIVLIARFEPGRRGGLLVATLSVILAAGALTDAQQKQKPTDVVPAIPLPPASASPNPTVTAQRSVVRTRVVGEEGEPVVKAGIAPASKTAPIARASFVETDEEGRFRIEAAPALGEYSVWKHGFFARQKVKLASDVDAEQVISLRRETPVRGTVLDAESGQLVPTFTLIAGRCYPYRTEATWKWEGQWTGEAGVFETALTAKELFSAPLGRLMVEAPGYQPAISELLALDAEVGPVEFRLRKAAPVRGVVLRPDGAVADLAELSLWAGELNMKDIPSRRRIVASIGGEFSIPPFEAERILVSHPSGFAELTVEQLRASSRVVLQPAGKVSGTLRLEGRPVSGQRVALSPIQYKYAVRIPTRVHAAPKTDSAGRFRITDVPPGDYWLVLSRARRAEMPGGGYSMPVGYSHGVPLTVTPGGELEVMLGGGGVPVVGNVAAEHDLIGASWQNAMGELTLVLTDPPDRPGLSEQDYPLNSERANDTGTIGFWRSEAGRARQRAMRIYLAVFEKDGTFRIDDVPAGRYRFSISVFDPGIEPNGTFHTAEREVTVAENVLTDLGRIQLRARVYRASP